MSCLFCQIAAGDIPCEKIYEDERILAFNDIDPKAPHHVLFIPKQHIETVNDLDENHNELMGHLIHNATKIAKQLGLAEPGYRLVLNCNRDGGQAVFHIHLHLLGGRKMEWPPG